ncbi:MAG TPA: amidohydrolase [Terriglobia bacterium]|nr:amidohydrolase [Terriglobia bacterium]
MKHMTWKTMFIAVFVFAAMAGSSAMLRAQQPAPDLILTNGKIITVDDQFSIAQALAIRGDHFVAVGNNQYINRLAGPNTRRIDLGGKAVIPGLIDSHAHLMRAAETWAIEARLDGVDTRKQALEVLRAKARELGPGQWVYNLGGWSYDQFSDDRRPFTRGELDQAVPNNPVYIQFTRCCGFLNSRGIEATGLAGMTERWIERDASGKPTGQVNEPGLAPTANKIPRPPKETFERNALALVRDLNQAGLTTAGISGCPAEATEFFRGLQRKGELSFRFMCMVNVNAGATVETVQKALPQIARIKLYQGDNWIDNVVWGETMFQPLHDNMLSVRTDPRPDQLALWRTLATEVAKARLPIHVHATIEQSITSFLDQIEAINEEYPVRSLHWTLAHLDQITASDLDRMKRLGMYAAVRAIQPVMGAVFARVHGERSKDMPPLRMIQDSGILWGFHTDTTEVNQYRPFTTLWFAVTGKMVGGMVVNRQPITREEALIAYTRKNSFLVFRESDLGSIQPGKLADLVVMDRDYLTVPADQIKDIKSVMTMVGGKVVYESHSR